MTVEIMKLPSATIDKNQVINFSGYDDRENFFDERINMTGWRYTDVEAPNFIKNLWKLYNEITIFDTSRIPLNVNYMRVRKGTYPAPWHYFYIYDFEDLGRNQMKYYLKLDTVATHLFYSTTVGGNIDYEFKEQLILREHKDRFSSTGTPIFDKTLEDIDIKPTVLNLKYQNPSSAPYTLVFKKFGGAVAGNEVLSYPIYAYDVHGIITSGNTVNTMTFTMPLGWGYETPVAQDSAIDFRWIDGAGYGSTITIKTKQRKVRHSINNDGDHFLEVIEGDIFSSSNVINISGPSASITSNGDIKLKGDGRLVLSAGYDTTAPLTLYIEKDRGFDYGTPHHSLSDRRFAQFLSSNRMIRPYRLDLIDYTESKTQKIIQLPQGFEFNSNTLQTGLNGARIILNSELGVVEQSIPMNTKTFNTTFNPNQNRIPLNDPKLYHSQFRPCYLSYLSESILLRRESLMNTLNLIPFKYKINNSDYSKMLLYSTINDINYQKSEMYELSKIIPLNNEVAVIKDDFNQYLDTNYRSDQRLQELQIARANRDLISNSVNQVVGIGAGIVGGAIAGNVAGAAIGGVAGTVRAVTNIANGIKNFNQMKEELKLNYEQKVKSLQYSLINITGATPEFNMLIGSDYFKLFEFSPREEELNYLDTYFHLYGYNTLEYKKPNLETRYHFNYIQMELVNYEVNVSTITTEVLEDIKERFRKGITILHAHFNETLDRATVDFSQIKENYERVLI